MKRIGFIDYYLSEWHANNYPAWIREASAKLGLEYEVSYAWAERDISPVDGVSTDGWCKTMGVTRCDTMEELCEKSDVILILAPSNPETHLHYAETALRYGKPTYIDKTFAPDAKTAEKIFAIAEEYGTPFFTTSALRYASELEAFCGAEDLIITGGGGNFPEYIIHTAEMAVMLLKDPVEDAWAETLGAQRVCRICTQTGKKALILYSPALSFSITGKLPDGTYARREITSDFFSVLMEEILRFYDTKTLPFDPAQTTEVMRLREMLLAQEA